MRIVLSSTENRLGKTGKGRRKGALASERREGERKGWRERDSVAQSRTTVENDSDPTRLVCDGCFVQATPAIKTLHKPIHID